MVYFFTMNPEPYVRNLKDSEIKDWMLEPDYQDYRMKHAFFAATLFLDEGNVTIIHDDKYVQQVEEAVYVSNKELVEKYGSSALDSAKEVAKRMLGKDNTAEFFELALRLYFGNPSLQLHHIRVRFEGREPKQEFGYSSQAPYSMEDVA